ncbi:hypothetical protein [Selenomonas ruminantium]|uniref:hypothetical protein n=1 Tax=Selenomonas ruminantium TaxID=971 RepID=UPI0026ED2424|nr:hypothetical protein [Selenomonas ruminantium]
MYKYSWKATLMTLGMMGVGKIALADEKSKANDSVQITSGMTESSNAGKLTDSPIDINDLSSKVKAIEDQLNQFQNIPFELIGIIIGLAIFALMLVFMFVLMQKRFARANRTIKSLRGELDHHQRLLESLNSRMDDMPEVPVQSTFVRGQYAEASVKQTISPLMQSKSMVVQAPTISESKTNPGGMDREKMLEFAQEYNRIQMITGREALSAKKDFQRKYNLNGFVCVNATERINHPEKKPQFQLSESLVDSAIWGFKIGDFYVVAPNPRQYVGDDHDYGGMKELFDSNFQPGRTYNKIKINNVAIMTHDLQIRKQGSLQLS